VNRTASTVETKPVNIDRDLYREMLITKIIPAIKAKFPCGNKNVEIQQDGAASYILENDPAFVAAATAGLWNITLLTQPPLGRLI
jgi:hypothetical protein